MNKTNKGNWEHHDHDCRKCVNCGIIQKRSDPYYCKCDKTLSENQILGAAIVFFLIGVSIGVTIGIYLSR